MALIKFDKFAFLESLEPGICSYVVGQFEEKLESKFNSLIEEVYSELREELPDKIKGKISHFLTPADNFENIRIEVDLSDKPEEEKNNV